MSDITQISKINIKRRINQNIYDAHSPKERCSISSLKKIYNYIILILNDI